jgi:hypothetical protein
MKFKKDILMNNIIQILPEKKYAGAPNSGLVIPFLNEAEGKTLTEHSVFKRINQLDQFYIDKAQCKNFRFSGRINQTINLDFSQVQIIPTSTTAYIVRLFEWYPSTPAHIYITINGNTQHIIIQLSDYSSTDMTYFYQRLQSAYNTELTAGDFIMELAADKSVINFSSVLGKDPVVVSSFDYPLSVQQQTTAQTNKKVVLPKLKDFDVGKTSNWRIMLMAPLPINSNTKGDTSITVSNNGVKRTLDFKKGLPALAIQAEIINTKTRNGLLLYLGHNLQNGDIVHITTTQTDTRYRDGKYRVVLVKGNKIYIQLIVLDSTNTSTVTATVESAATDGNSNLTSAVVSGIELGITTGQFNSLTGSTDPVNWLAVFNPHVFVTKVVDKLPCEYYLKRLNLLREMQYGDVYNCSFAANIFSQSFYLCTVEDKMALVDMKNNFGMPLTDVYLVFAKKTDSTLQMTPVWASFSNFMTSTFADGALQTVSRTSNTQINVNTATMESTDGMPMSDITYDASSSFLYHSLVEYNPLIIEEKEINKINHTFLTNTGDTQSNHIRFSYDPFTHIPIRKLSNNIDTTDSILGLPSYIEEDYRNSFYNEKFQNYRWRHVLELGYFEAQGNGIDFPYLNDAFYVYTNVLLNLKNYKSTKIASLLTGGYILSSYVDTLIPPPDVDNTTGIDELDDSLLDQNKYDKPFEAYTGIIC